MKYVILISAFFVMVLMSCNSSTGPNQPGTTTQNDTLIFKFDSLAAFPYSQSIMVSGYSDKIFIYGAYGQLSVYNTIQKTLTNISTMNDTMTWRWDGAFVAVDSMMYIFAASADNHYDKVLTLNPRTYEIRETAAPFLFANYIYPAYGVSGKKILILYPAKDSLYVFDTETMTGRFVSQNKLKDQISGEKDYSSCVYNNDFYLFNIKVKRLFKINTQSYDWQEVIIPDSIKSEIGQAAFGGLIENKLCLFNQRNGSGVIVAYNLATQKWLTGNSNTDIDIIEPSFYSAGSSLYVGEVYSKTLWKISLVH